MAEDGRRVMSPERLSWYLSQGEGQAIEFKRCGTMPHADTFETICSFANRLGGDLFLGVEDDGTVSGIERAAALDIERNIVNVTSNPNVFSPTPPLEFEKIDHEGKVVVRVWVPMGPAVYRYKGAVFDRMADVDVRVTSDDAISLMYIHKRGYYSERKVYPHMGRSDLRDDLIDRARRMARANRRDHPWGSLDDDELIRAADLFEVDRETGHPPSRSMCPPIGRSPDRGNFKGNE